MKKGSKPMQQIIVHLDANLADAMKRWATDEERSVSAQVRKLVRDQTPNKYFQPEEATTSE